MLYKTKNRKLFFFQIQKQHFKIKTVFDFTHRIKIEKINEKQTHLEQKREKTSC